MRADKCTEEKYKRHTSASLAIIRVEVAGLNSVADVGDSLTKTRDD